MLMVFLYFFIVLSSWDSMKYCLTNISALGKHKQHSLSPMQIYHLLKYKFYCMRNLVQNLLIVLWVEIILLFNFLKKDGERPVFPLGLEDEGPWTSWVLEVG